MSSNTPVWEPNAERVERDITTLSTFVDPDQPGWTRRPFTRWYEEARAWLRNEMETAGLHVKVDAAANLIGRREGATPDLAPILVGSHIDTVQGGGRFDGVIGVVGALELARRLHETGRLLRQPLEIIDFTAEEPTDFGISAVGSRGMVGALEPDMLTATDSSGRTLRDALAAIGGRPSDLAAEARREGDVAVYLELHIEQGPILEQEGLTLGVVTGIVGIERVRITVIGQPSHAGTTPMSLRHDALCGAAEMILAFERLCRTKSDAGIVGTVGRLSVEPNAANVVPGKVEFLAEVRCINTETSKDVLGEFEAQATDLALKRGVEVEFEQVTSNLPVQIQPAVLEILQVASEKTASPALLLPSGAGHDANQMAHIAPVGMLFVPSRGGLSHCPEEWTEKEAILKGVEALIRAVLLYDEVELS
jgi:N-carbamoyl-L-amino-acid hydrolase